ncbi:hypothetical protein ACFUKV_27580 [Streptomyces paradoxus]
MRCAYTFTLSQHREVLALSGWLALLVGCVEYDTVRPGMLPSRRGRPPYR